MSHGSDRFAYLGREIAVRTHRLAEAWRDLASVSWLAVTRRDCLDDFTGATGHSQARSRHRRPEADFRTGRRSRGPMTFVTEETFEVPRQSSSIGQIPTEPRLARHPWARGR